MSLEGSDLTNCSICLETFKDPKYLICLHTFCKKCLSDYISTQVQEGSRGFPCPVCRHFNVVKDFHRTRPEDVSNRLPTNCLIAMLIDQQRLEKKLFVCNPCTNRGRMEATRYWCYTCDAALCGACGEFHNSLPILTDHRIAQIETVNDVEVVTSMYVCDVHPGKSLEMFCHDHDVACCAICKTEVHGQCKNVVTFLDAVKDPKNLTVIGEFGQKMENLIQKIDSRVEDLNSACSGLKTQNETRRQQIQEFSSKSLGHVDNMKSEFLEKLSQVRDDNLKKIRERKECLLNMRRMISNCENLLKLAEAKCTNIQLLTLIPKVSKLRDETKDKIEEIEKNPMTIDVQVNIDIDFEVCVNCTSLGHLVSVADD